MDESLNGCNRCWMKVYSTPECDRRCAWLKAVRPDKMANYLKLASITEEDQYRHSCGQSPEAYTLTNDGGNVRVMWLARP